MGIHEWSPPESPICIPHYSFMYVRTYVCVYCVTDSHFIQWVIMLSSVFILMLKIFLFGHWAPANWLLYSLTDYSLNIAWRLGTRTSRCCCSEGTGQEWCCGGTKEGQQNCISGRCQHIGYRPPASSAASSASRSSWRGQGLVCFQSFVLGTSTWKLLKAYVLNDVQVDK